MRRDAAINHRRVLELYAKGLTTREIAKRTGLAKTTVSRHLLIANVPKVNGPRRAAPVHTGRAPWWRLRAPGTTNAIEIVCGRKHCAGCGRWRHLADFPHDMHGGVDHGPVARCYRCSRVGRAYYYRHQTPEQRANLNERLRFYKHGQRRAAGVPELGYIRRSVVDRAEYVFVPKAALVAELERRFGQWDELARKAGIPARTIFRIVHEDGRFVRVDIADRLAVAMGMTFTLIYPDAQTSTSARPRGEAAA